MIVKDELLNIGRNVKVGGLTVFKTAFYGDNYEANATVSDDAVYPMCQVAQILTGGFAINQKTGSQRDKWNVFVFFCDKIDTSTGDGETDTTAVKQDVIIEAMRIACKRFIADMMLTGLFEVPTNVDMKSLFFQKDTSLTGILAFFTVTERNASILC